MCGKIRIPDILARKNAKLNALTCYDAMFARLLEKTNLDVVLVGDSLGHVVQGKNSTISVTLEHVACVAATLKTPLLVSDMPFGHAGIDLNRAVSGAVALMQAGAEAVKIEGASLQTLALIEALAEQGIPVMGHIGLMPQSVHALGGSKIQGKEGPSAQRLRHEAHELQNAGCFALVLELVDSLAAEHVTEDLTIPTIGIGSGKGCDGKILVLHDMLGLNSEFKPKFLRHFAKLEEQVLTAVAEYVHDVERGEFPNDGH